MNHIYGLTSKLTESVLKYGAEVATACDPLSAAIAIGGKLGVGASLSKFSASQCAGLIGVIVSSITPQVSAGLQKCLFLVYLLGIGPNFVEKNCRGLGLLKGSN